MLDGSIQNKLNYDKNGFKNLQFNAIFVELYSINTNFIYHPNQNIPLTQYTNLFLQSQCHFLQQTKSS